MLVRIAAWLSGERARFEAAIAQLRAEFQQEIDARTAVLNREIEARRAAEEAARASERRYRLLSESASEIVWAVDLQGAVTYVSPSVAVISGYTREDLLPLSWQERVAVGLPQEGFAQLQQALADLRQGLTWHERTVVNSHVHRDGSLRWTETTLVPLYAEDGAPDGLRLATRDVTAREEALAALRHSEERYAAINAELEARVAARTADLQEALTEKERALQLRNELMALISHELRTPLTTVLGTAEVLEDEVVGPLNARQRTYVANIRRGGERLTELVNGVISYSLLISGDVPLHPAYSPILPLLQETVKLLEAKAAARQQSVCVMAEPPDLMATVDAYAVKQLLLRLLENAIKFTPPGGAIGTEAKVSDGHLQVVVWDTGIGLTADLAELIVPFAQGQRGLDRRYEGAGLGLAYVARMLELLDGELHYEPNPQGGSRFVVTLPSGTTGMPADEGALE